MSVGVCSTGADVDGAETKEGSGVFGIGISRFLSVFSKISAKSAKLPF